MGMFDRIEFRNWEKWFPNSEISFLFDEEWQTKSLENTLSLFTVEEDGTLTIEDYRHYDHHKPERKTYWFHGEVYAHTYVSNKDFSDDASIGGVYSSAEIKLLFTKGVLESVEVISVEKEKPFPKVVPRNMIEHIKEIVNLDYITIPTSFMVYGFDIRELENGSWAITRCSAYSIMRDFTVKEGVHGEYISHKEAFNFIIKFFQLVKEDKITHPLLEQR